MDQSATIQHLRDRVERLERTLIDLAQLAALGQRVSTRGWMNRLAAELDKVQQVLPQRIERIGALLARTAAADRQPTFQHRCLEEMLKARVLLVNCLQDNLPDIDLASTPVTGYWIEVLDWYFGDGGDFGAFLRELQQEAAAKGYELLPAEAGDRARLVYQKSTESTKAGTQRRALEVPGTTHEGASGSMPARGRCAAGIRAALPRIGNAHPLRGIGGDRATAGRTPGRRHLLARRFSSADSLAGDGR